MGTGVTVISIYMQHGNASRVSCIAESRSRHHRVESVFNRSVNRRPTKVCQALTGSWLVIRVDLVPTRSSIKHFEQVISLRRPHRGNRKVINHQNVQLGQLRQTPGKAAIAMGHMQFIKEPPSAHVQHRET